MEVMKEGNPRIERGRIIALLDELLEAERAGARVTLRTAVDTQDEVLRVTIESIHRDEVKWCAMLMRVIRDLQGTPSARTGAFHDKAMAIEDLRERMAFLNRGQRWVVRKVRELLSMIDDADVRRDLTEMLDAHQANIDRVNLLLEGSP